MSGFLLFALGFLCGAGLVLALRRRGGRDLTGPPNTLARSPSAAAIDDDDIRELIRRNRKIEAIKLLRERSGLDLKASKEAVDALECAMR